MVSVWTLAVALAVWWAMPACAAGIPDWLPRYDLDIRLEVDGHQAIVRERVTWFNRHDAAATELVFNAHSHFRIPKKDVALLAKSLEILRIRPSEALDFEGHACDVRSVRLVEPATAASAEPGAFRPVRAGPSADLPLHAPRPLPPRLSDLAFHYRPDNDTALVVPLPRRIARGQCVTIELDFVLRLPAKQGRWGQWKGITFLVNWLPVLAYYDNAGWQPTPFVPWHQPFFNEAGLYTARVTLPADHRVACSGTILQREDLPFGWQRLDIRAWGVRDFALIASPLFQEFTALAGSVRIHVLALPEHAFYAQEMLRIATEAVTAYSSWFGPYPFPDFTVVESYFGWNGNECGGLVMIDARIFALPHLAVKFVDYLLSHETCHQWWYGAVGTNGYAETWMDEGLATYFGYRLMREKYGRNDKILTLPKGLEWLPNIDRETYRFFGMYGTLGRGEEKPTVTDFPNFGHLINLCSMTYDRGGKIMGMIEDRLGEAAFLDFMRHVYARYQFRVLRVADFQHELECYTGHPEYWQQFFRDWLYGAGLTDWCVEKVSVRRCTAEESVPLAPVLPGPRIAPRGPYRVTVVLRQKAEYNEHTVVGFCLDGSDVYQVRVPLIPQGLPMELDDPPARITALPDNRFQVETVLPCKPTQVAVDPDQILLDRNPANNYWKPPIRCRFTPIYTQAEETDVTTAYDRWNVIFGPWVYGASYSDPWFTRSTRLGVRAGAYRTQEFDGGMYLAYRPDERDLVAGADAVLDHWPWPHTQVGLVAERGLTDNYWGHQSDRAVLYGRYVFLYGSSLYLPPMHYLEAFTSITDFNLPPPWQPEPGGERVDHQTTGGLHYHLDFLTPYWDPDAGFRIDATYGSGVAVLGDTQGFEQFSAQFSTVRKLPGDDCWLSQTRLAARIYGAGALPTRGEFFPLGGSTLLRGFDLRQRQGSAVWVGSVEWRVPLIKGLTCDCLDHTVGLRNVYGAAFYDVGEAFLAGRPLDGVAHSVGAGLRLDVAWFSLIERTILRLDVAKTVNANTPTQVWVGLEHPF